MSKYVETPGTIVLHNIPRGFRETNMQSYFEQFGKVTKVKMSRSRKTGNIKGYAYIEFASSEVAKIAAETMNNYLMFERILRCRFIPKDKYPKNLYRLWNSVRVTTVERHKNIVNSQRSYENERASIKKRLTKIRAVEKKLASVGLKFKCLIVNDPKNESFELKSQDQIVVDSSDEDVVIKTPKTAIKVKKNKQLSMKTAGNTPNMNGNSAKKSFAKSDTSKKSGKPIATPKMSPQLKKKLDKKLSKTEPIKDIVNVEVIRPKRKSLTPKTHNTRSAKLRTPKFTVTKI
ncbi:MKI67 FHA domain-interacting nucleolar phosphoprotein [Halotydeus destructor]|nr:MKI67 FHA domain-interacting nucleolar phosphoprotein [Halotydeus destructor]